MRPSRSGRPRRPTYPEALASAWWRGAARFRFVAVRATDDAGNVSYLRSASTRVGGELEGVASATARDGLGNRAESSRGIKLRAP